MSNGYATTAYPNGVTNAPVGTALQTFSAPDPTISHTYFNDFDSFAAGDWTVTETQAGATQAVAAGDGGWLALVNSAANNDLNSIQLAAASFAITAGKEAWFKTRFKTSSATNAALVIGLIQTTATPLTVTNGVYFIKAAASTSLIARATASSTSSSLTVGTMADDTFLTAGWHYDGGSLISVFLNGNRVGSLPTTNLPSSALNLTIAESNGTAAAITTTIDYVLASTERPSTSL